MVLTDQNFWDSPCGRRNGYADCDLRRPDCRREILLEYCAQYAKENLLPIATLAYEKAGMLLNSRESKSADVMFLNIYMDGALGVDAARILRGKDFRGALVFTTTSAEHNAGGFNVEAAHYLRKPAGGEAFCASMRRVHDRMNTAREGYGSLPGGMKWTSTFPASGILRTTGTRPCCTP